MKKNIHRDTKHHHNDNPHNAFDNPKILAEKFDAPERDKWQKPNEAIQSFNLRDDSVAVEIGANTGYFSVKLSEYVPNGKIIGFEPSPNIGKYLKKEQLALN